LLLAAIFIMLPKIFSVNKTNMKVLSLFGYILPDEIKKLADKCEVYMEEYLDEAAIHKEYSSYFSSHESEEREQLTKQQEEDEDDDGEEPYSKRNLTNVEELHNQSVTSGNQDFSLQMREFSKHEDQIKLPVLSARTSVHNSPGRFMPSTYRTSIMPTTSRATARDDKPLINIREPPISPTNAKLLKDKNGKEDPEEDEDLQEYLRERSKKLKNSKDHSKKGVIMRMLILGSIFAAYFVGDFIHELIFLKNYRRLLEHLTLLSARTSDLRYAFTFGQEEIYENNITAVYPSCNFICS